MTLEIYLIARTDPTGTFYMQRNESLPESLHHLIDLGAYSTRPHGVALWRMDKLEGTLEKLLDLPGCGDTAFPSIVRISASKFLVANYTSPLSRCEGCYFFYILPNIFRLVLVSGSSLTSWNRNLFC